MHNFFLCYIGNPIPIAVFGAFAYGLSTYLLIILQVGHNTKAQALAYMPLVIGGMYMILHGRCFRGFILTVFALSMQMDLETMSLTIEGQARLSGAVHEGGFMPCAARKRHEVVSTARRACA